MIPFNVPPYVGTELDHLTEAIRARKICGDGEFTRRCSRWMEEKFGAEKVLLTTSGTAALDMALLLCDLRPEDEVILPSYTFSSTANSVILGGGKPVFVDVRPDTMNIDENKLEAAITERTRAIVAVHYAGVACEMDAISAVAEKYGLRVIEDAAQGVMAKYKGRYLGTLGDFGCYSFHETKNYSMGEGGAIVINDPAFIERAKILREKGTNRSKFFRGAGGQVHLGGFRGQFPAQRTERGLSVGPVGTGGGDQRGPPAQLERILLHPEAPGRSGAYRTALCSGGMCA